jgi:hypothetical protein
VAPALSRSVYGRFGKVQSAIVVDDGGCFRLAIRELIGSVNTSTFIAGDCRDASTQMSLPQAKGTCAHRV